MHDATRESPQPGQLTAPTQQAHARTNHLKSVFIGIYPLFAMGTAAYAVLSAVTTGNAVAWAGALLTVVPILVFLTRAMLFRSMARTSDALPALHLLAFAGAAASAYAVSVSRSESLLPFALALSGAAALAVYTGWYSRLGRRASSVLAVGRKLPDLALQRPDGSDFSTAELAGSPALVLFYRGNWCPLCMAQIKEVAARYRELRRLGARVLLVSPQSHDKTAELADRFDVDFDFLVDEGGRTGRALELEMKNGLPMGMTLLGYDPDTVFPTVLVVDSTGVIRWLDQTDNYRVRPEPETFIPIIAELAGRRSS